METTYDPPDDGATGAILEICEIEVYGTKKTTNKSISKIHKEGLLPFKMRDSGGGCAESSPRERLVRSSNPSRDRPKSLKQVVTAPLPNARY